MGIIETSIPSRDGFIARQNYVYVMIAPHVDNWAFVKVGVSMDPMERLGQIASASPVRIGHLRAYRIGPRNRAFSIEYEIHYRLAEFHVRGEWFQFDMANPEHKSALWGAVKATLARFFRDPPPPMDFPSEQIEEAVRVCVQAKRVGRRKMLNPVDTAVGKVLRSREIRRTPPIADPVGEYLRPFRK